MFQVNRAASPRWRPTQRSESLSALHYPQPATTHRKKAVKSRSHADTFLWFTTLDWANVEKLKHEEETKKTQTLFFSWNQRSTQRSQEEPRDVLTHHICWVCTLNVAMKTFFFPFTVAPRSRMSLPHTHTSRYSSVSTSVCLLSAWKIRTRLQPNSGRF